MLILKHVEFDVRSRDQLNNLLSHIEETASQVDGIIFKNIYFVKDKKEFVLFMESKDEQKYHEWRKICPPPPGASDWYEVFQTRDELFPD